MSSDFHAGANPSIPATASEPLRFQAAVTLVLRDERVPGPGCDLRLPGGLIPADRELNSLTIQHNFDRLSLETVEAVDHLVQERANRTTANPEGLSGAPAAMIDPTMRPADLRVLISAKILKADSPLFEEKSEQMLRCALAQTETRPFPVEF